MLAEVRCSVCGARFRKEDHVYERIKQGLPWTTLKDRLRDESLELINSMSTNGVDSMGTYHRMLVLSETVQAIASQMQRVGKQQLVKP